MTEDYAEKDLKAEDKSSFFKDWIIPILFAIICALILHRYVFMRVVIPSESMEPAIMTNDVMYVSRLHDLNNVKRGDILVFYSNEKGEEDTKLIKRLIGLPFDKVSVVEGRLYINGKLIDEPYVKNNDNISKDFVVPKDKYLFFGDNRMYSYDARKWENPFIDKDKIIAKAGLRVRPFNKIGFIK